MLQMGHIDPLKMAFNFFRGPEIYPLHTGPIDHIMLMEWPIEIYSRPYRSY